MLKYTIIIKEKEETIFAFILFVVRARYTLTHLSQHCLKG